VGVLSGKPKEVSTTPDNATAAIIRVLCICKSFRNIK
jgi:hypothetical protein